MLIGLDRIAGYFGSAAVGTWAAEGRKLATTDEIGSEELAARMGSGEVAVLDVREQTEWEAFRIPGVPNIPLGYLTERLDEVPRDRTVVLHCQEGSRSGTAASLLHAHGIANVVNLRGGIRAWMTDGNPVQRGGSGAGGS